MSDLARDVLLHPERLRIVQALVNQPMTAAQIKDRLGNVAQATLYRHLDLLEAGGLIEIADERRVRGATERTFRVVESAVMLGDDDLSDATSEEHFRYFAIFLGTLLSDFAAYLDDGEPDLLADGVGYQQMALWLTDAEFQDMVSRLVRVFRPLMEHEPAPGRRRRLVTSILMPDDRSRA